MALTNDQITAQNFKSFYNQIRPYLNGTAHNGFTPVGTVISLMGKTAPANYLICDGTVYNIADYPELAAYFADQFNASNFFGGDGTTTFAVPDLRGEFLRGSGTNSHTGQGSGSTVGTHQDATKEVDMFTVSDTGAATTKYKNIDTQNADAWFGSSTKYYCSKATAMYEGTFSDGDRATYHSSRPTNTSVLYCIATKNIFMDAGNNYSSDEIIVGTWINGKPLYQKTITTTAPTVATAGTYVVVSVAHGVSNVDVIFTPCAFVKDNSNIARMMPYTVNAGYQIKANPGRSGIQFTSAIKDFNGCTCYITIQYTKLTD